MKIYHQYRIRPHTQIQTPNISKAFLPIAAANDYHDVPNETSRVISPSTRSFPCRLHLCPTHWPRSTQTSPTAYIQRPNIIQCSQTIASTKYPDSSFVVDSGMGSSRGRSMTGYDIGTSSSSRSSIEDVNSIVVGRTKTTSVNEKFTVIYSCGVSTTRWRYISDGIRMSPLHRL